MNIYSNQKLRKPIRIGLGVVLCVLFITLLVAASNHQEQQPIKGFALHIVNGSGMGILEKKNLEHWILKDPKVNVKGRLKNELNLEQIEAQASLNPWVANADVYVDNNNQLQIDITERKPVARVFELNGQSFYMDSSLKKMPVITGNNFSTPVFTNAFFVKDDSMNRALSSKIVMMANLIGKDSFWNAMIGQVIVNADQTFTLIPLFAKRQQVIFGDTTRANEKLANLFAFYKHIPGKVGWDNYRILDLRYQGQIVARPSLQITLLKPKDPLAQRETIHN